MNRKSSLYILFSFFFFLNCSGQSNSSANDFVFTNGKERIIVAITTGNNYIVSDAKSIAKINVENIDIKTLNFSGKGIRFLPVPDSPESVYLEIMPSKESIIDGKLSLIISYASGDKNISHKFIIPIK